MSAVDLVQEVVVEEGVSRFGLHRVHVMRMGAAVDVDQWVKERVGEGVVKGWWEYKEEEMDVYHLWLWWKDDEERRIGDG